jgi:hypothetical protein
MADGKQDDEQPCWCKTEQFPQALLNKVPATAKHRACICQRCLESNKDKTSA